jgi:hypothetical protein
MAGHKEVKDKLSGFGGGPGGHAGMHHPAER